jgi:hypothetical protein
VYGSQVGCPARVLQTGPFEESPKVFERYSSVELHESALDDVFQLNGVNSSRAAEGQEMTPGFGGKSASFVGSHDPESHRLGVSVIHSRNLFLGKSRSKLTSKGQREAPNLFYKLFSVKEFSIDHKVCFLIKGSPGLIQSLERGQRILHFQEGAAHPCLSQTNSQPLR